MAPSILFIVNPTAGGGRGRQRWQRFEQRLATEAGAGPHSPRHQAPTGEALALRKTVFTERSGEAERIAAEAASDYDLLVAVGGDGTVSEVANGILRANTGASLAIVPCGTGNDIARAAGIRGLEEAYQGLARQKPKKLDVIRVSCAAGGQAIERYALLFGGVGIIAPVLRNTTLRSKRLLGQGLAYRLGLLRSLLRYSASQMRVNCDGKEFEGRFLFLGMNNGEDAGGGMKIAPGARIDDGLLNVNLVGDVGRWEGLKELRRLSRGQHTNHPKVRYFTAQTILVHTEEPIEVAIDGDLIGWTPASFEVRPAALALVGP